MPCTTVREQLHTLSDGERLTHWRETAAVVTHCLRCSKCRIYFRQMRRLRKTTRHLPRNPDIVLASLQQRTLSDMSLSSNYPVTVSVKELRRRQSLEGRKSMNRITLATTALVLPMIVAVATTKSYRKPSSHTQNLATLEAFNKPKPLFVETTRQPINETPLPTESQRPGEPKNAEFLERLQELRTKWEVWAREHQGDLAAMLRETGDERVAYDRIMNAMPIRFEYNGNDVLNGADLDVPGLPFVYVPQYQNHTGLWKMPNNFKGYLLRDGDEEVFERMRADQALDKKHPRNTRHFIPERDRERFRDIAIVTTRKSGNAYTLWISGRITEHTPTLVLYDLPELREHKIIRTSEGEEIVPPYPFLTE